MKNRSGAVCINSGNLFEDNPFGICNSNPAGFPLLFPLVMTVSGICLKESDLLILYLLLIFSQLESIEMAGYSNDPKGTLNQIQKEDKADRQARMNNLFEGAE